LRNTVISSDAGAVPADLPTIPPRAAQSAEIVAADNQRVVVRAKAADPAILVLADQWYPGWQARVDGVLAPIMRVNTVLRGVSLAPGDHKVVFEFQPPALWIGGVLTIVGLLLVAALIVISLRRQFI
jgi:uncharacterized membrane protein YfhO